MNSSRVFKIALEKPTLQEALVYVAVCEMERIVKQAKNQTTYESCFGYYFESILQAGKYMSSSVSVQVKTLFDLDLWMDYCQQTGTNCYAILDGLMSENEFVNVPIAVANQIGLLSALSKVKETTPENLEDKSDLDLLEHVLSITGNISDLLLPEDYETFKNISAICADRRDGEDV